MSEAVLPLRGLTFRPGVSHTSDWLLASMGATASGRDGTDPEGADLISRLEDEVDETESGAGLPPGTLEYCMGVAIALGALAGRTTSGLAVALQLRLPEVMAAAYGASFEMRPPAPVAAPTGGWVHADLGAPGDREDFARLLESLPPGTGTGARQLAAAAQAWRLPVCDYRPWTPAPPRLPVTFAAGAAASGPSPAWPDRELRVLDLTNMWAGPLATWILHDLGAVVTKVEPSFRPDGFRAVAGGGIYPGDRPCAPGRDSAMWNALNYGKAVVDLDLRSDADRARFLDLARSSDVVIDSFSPRVMPNFGFDLPPGPLYASVPAFPPGPERDWVAYGSGVHAASGLGDTRTAGYAAAAVSYPDPVAGLTAALGVVAALVGRRRGISVSRLECSLGSSVQPLLSRTATAQGSLLADPAGIGALLARRGRAQGLMEDRVVCGRPLAHPVSLFTHA